MRHIILYLKRYITWHTPCHTTRYIIWHNIIMSHHMTPRVTPDKIHQMTRHDTTHDTPHDTQEQIITRHTAWHITYGTPHYTPQDTLWPFLHGTWGKTLVPSEHNLVGISVRPWYRKYVSIWLVKQTKVKLQKPWLRPTWHTRSKHYLPHHITHHQMNLFNIDRI